MTDILKGAAAILFGLVCVGAAADIIRDTLNGDLKWLIASGVLWAVAGIIQAFSKRKTKPEGQAG